MTFINTHSPAPTVDIIADLKLEGTLRTSIHTSPTLFKEVGLKGTLPFETIQGLLTEVVTVSQLFFKALRGCTFSLRGLFSGQATWAWFLLVWLRGHD